METDLHKVSGAPTPHEHQEESVAAPHVHDDGDGGGHHHDHEHDHDTANIGGMVKRLVASFVLLGIFVALERLGVVDESSWILIVGYLISFLPVGVPVLLEAVEITREDTFFNECSLMSIASIGAFCIGEYPEAVMLMCLYTLGEIFQGKAVHSAKKSITSLIDSRSDKVQLVTAEGYKEVQTEEVRVGDVILVQTGDIVPLDGKLLGDRPRDLDLSALTGESMPVTKNVGDEVLAGSVSRREAFQLEVTKPYSESTLSRIMRMSEEAAEQKPRTEQFIRRFARVYTPIVFGLAVLIIVLPYLIQGAAYDFDQWLYRGLVFLVTSCPCALVISVPLSYFSGLGAASRNGLLFKGGVYLEVLRKVNAMIFDKTGTLTEGTFEHVELETFGTHREDEIVPLIKAMEHNSNHPIALAVLKKYADAPTASVRDVRELSGRGMSATYEGTELYLGNKTLMDEVGVSVPGGPIHPGKTVLYFSLGGELVATVMLSDAIKRTSHAAIRELRKRGVHPLVMLSGDKADVAERVAEELGLDEAKGGLLPDDKMREVRALMDQHTVAYVGDGLNDAPVMNMVPVGVAMGGLGSDATIEAADVVIQGDDPYALVNALDIAKKTNRIVVENITLSLSVKIIVMVLATLGYASLTMAIIADVGVTLLTVLNAVRVLRFKGAHPGDQR